MKQVAARLQESDSADAQPQAGALQLMLAGGASMVYDFTSHQDVYGSCGTPTSGSHRTAAC